MGHLLKMLSGALFGVFVLTGQAAAHPHVFVTMVSELVYAPDGTITGVRHAWTFDDMFSAFATQGLESKVKGRFTREELAPLAEVNVTSLKEYEYFNFGRADGKKIEFKDAVDYWLDYKDEVLTLHFLLPLKAPVRAKALDLEVYDPSYFVDFTFAKSNPVKLAGAPGACKLATSRAGDSTATQKLSEAFFNQPNASQNWGAQFANKIAVTC